MIQNRFQQPRTCKPTEDKHEDCRSVFFLSLSLSLLLTLQMQIYHPAGVSCSEWSKWACVTGNKSGHTPVRRSRGEQFQTTCGTCVMGVGGEWMSRLLLCNTALCSAKTLRNLCSGLKTFFSLLIRSRWSLKTKQKWDETHTHTQKKNERKKKRQSERKSL